MARNVEPVGFKRYRGEVRDSVSLSTLPICRLEQWGEYVLVLNSRHNLLEVSWVQSSDQQPRYNINKPPSFGRETRIVSLILFKIHLVFEIFRKMKNKNWRSESCAVV